MPFSVSDPTPFSSQPATSTAQPSTARYVPHVTVGVEVFDRALLRRVSQDALAELKTLANMIQSSVEQIEAVITANSLTFPSQESPFSLESEAPRMHPTVQSAGLLITSAAAQLMTLVRPAPLTMLDIMMQVIEFFSCCVLLLTKRESSMFPRHCAPRSAPMSLRSFGTLAPR